ncbi:MAG: hypothetical protein K6E40_10000, partial [Desulfovibrio sp.]|nr:hypothetical protein [Desulfovibrio sp.]
AVLVPGLPNNPNHDLRGLAGGVDQQLAKVIVVCLAELIFDDDAAPSPFFVSQDVSLVDANGSSVSSATMSMPSSVLKSVSPPSSQSHFVKCMDSCGQT